MSQLAVASTYSGRWDNWGVGSWNEWLSQSSKGGSNGEIKMFVKHWDGANQDKWEVAIGFAQFNTSALPDNALISSAYLRCVMGWNNESFSGPGAAISWMATGNRYDDALDEYTTGNILGAASDQGGGVRHIVINNPNTNISKTGWTKFHFGTQQSMNRVSPGPAAPYPGQDDYYIFGNDAGANNIQIVITYTTPPAVTTGVASLITGISARLAGEVTDAGGGTVSERGIVLSLNPNPTTADTKIVSAGGVGAFTVDKDGLTSGKEYHYRAFVTTEHSTVYGSDLTFKTLSGGFFALI